MDIKYESKNTFVGKIGCIEICVESTYDMMVKIIKALNAKYKNVALAKPNAFMDDIYDAIFLYKQSKDLTDEDAAKVFLKIINEADTAFTNLRFDKDPKMIDAFAKVNTDIESEYYTTGLIQK